jgi:bacteriorhodopsin
MIGYPGAAVVAGAQFFFWIIWAAFCASMSLQAASGSTLTYRFLCYLIGFAFCTGPIGYLLHKEQRTAETSNERIRIETGAIMYGIAVM